MRAKGLVHIKFDGRIERFIGLIAKGMWYYDRVRLSPLLINTGHNNIFSDWHEIDTKAHLDQLLDYSSSAYHMVLT